MRHLYTLLMHLLAPLLRAKLYWRARREPAYAHNIPARFGHYGQNDEPITLQTQRPFVWIHAVSLGETKAAGILLAALRKKIPHLRLLLTHSTATGLAAGRELLQADDVQTWLPWDTPAAVARFFAAYRPCIGILMETEIWPNLIHHAHALGVPMVLANARMSASSMRGFAWLPSLSQPAFSKLALVLAQDHNDANRLTTLGAPQVERSGNIKYDADANLQLVNTGKRWRVNIGHTVITLASSREGDEALFLNALRSREEQLQALGVQCAIVPRHPQRFSEVAALIVQHKWLVQKRSIWGKEGGQPNYVPQSIILGDSMGEMSAYYGMSDAVLMGGSFTDFGGQNPIEALATGCPVWIGPNTQNFSQIVADGSREHCIKTHPNMESALDEILDYFAHLPARQSVAYSLALNFVQKHRGGAEKSARAIRSLLLRTPYANPY